jgi:ribulose-5-phosphate 4-epimerase/fuculose-1-phosphate aldolase
MKSNTFQEGYIKFKCHFNQVNIDIPAELFTPLNYWRNFLRDKQWIGSYADGIGFGNISIRIPGSNRFFITGSATGSLTDLETKNYALVERCDPATNMIWCKGLIQASAESMSHYTIYKTIPEAAAVVHIHNRPLWDKYLDVLPTTAKEVSYGTPEMAYEIEHVLKLPEMKFKRVAVMGGHEEGIISYGISIEEAVKAMIELEN